MPGPLIQKTAAELSETLRKKETSSREIVSAFLECIQKKDTTVHAFNSINAEDALKQGVDAAEAQMRDAGESARDAAVNEADQTAEALDTAADTFDADALQAAALRQLSDAVTSGVAGLRDKPVDALVDDAALFARRNPAVFLAGAALLGFAAARVLKAPSPRPDERDDPWTGHLGEAQPPSEVS